MSKIEKKIEIDGTKHKIRIHPKTVNGERKYGVYFDTEVYLFGLMDLLPFEDYSTRESKTVNSVEEAIDTIEQLILSRLERVDGSDPQIELESAFNDGIDGISEQSDNVSVIE